MIWRGSQQRLWDGDNKTMSLILHFAPYTLHMGSENRLVGEFVIIVREASVKAMKSSYCVEKWR